MYNRPRRLYLKALNERQLQASSGLAICATLTILLSSPVAAQHTGFWREATQTGEAAECRLVENESDMLNVLKRVGWPVNRNNLPIDWKKDCAIIIAPSNYYKNGQLAFYRIEWDGSKYQLKWGWTPIDGTEVRGGSSATFGSTLEGRPETIVVAFQHGMHANNAFVCTNLGFDP